VSVPRTAARNTSRSNHAASLRVLIRSTPSPSQWSRSRSPCPVSPYFAAVLLSSESPPRRPCHTAPLCTPADNCLRPVSL
jgi:hypothetical protein